MVLGHTLLPRENASSPNGSFGSTAGCAGAPATAGVAATVTVASAVATAVPAAPLVTLPAAASANGLARRPAPARAPTGWRMRRLGGVVREPADDG
eukprot:tig00000331_g24166.t1